MRIIVGLSWRAPKQEVMVDWGIWGKVAENQSNKNYLGHEGFSNSCYLMVGE